MGENTKIALSGDVMLGRLVNDAISLYGYTYPWEKVLENKKHSGKKQVGPGSIEKDGWEFLEGKNSP